MIKKRKSMKSNNKSKWGKTSNKTKQKPKKQKTKTLKAMNPDFKDMGVRRTSTEPSCVR